MENRRGRKNQNLETNYKKPVKNIIFIIIILLILSVYFHFSKHFSSIKQIQMIILIINIPLIIALLYLIIDFLRAKRKRYIGTIILMFLYFICSMPLFLINNPTTVLNKVITPVNIALCGTDTRENNSDISNSSRCDSASILNINASNETINIVSIPRDAYVLDTCTNNYDKLTHTSLEGMDCYVGTLENLLSININAYVKINFTSLITAIDSVGGVDITVDQSFYGQDEYDNDDIYYFEGGTTMHLNGSQALSYARERKSFSDGDYTRAYHQQQVMNALFLQLIASGKDGIYNFYNNILNVVDTNLNKKTLLQLSSNLLTLKSIDKNSYIIQGSSSTADVPSRDLYDLSVQILDEQSVNEAMMLLEN